MLPCPLCSGKATNFFTPDDSYGAAADITRCDGCDVSASVYADVGDASIKGTSIPRWNSIVERAEASRLQLAALEAQAAKLCDDIEMMFD